MGGREVQCIYEGVGIVDTAKLHAGELLHVYTTLAGADLKRAWRNRKTRAKQRIDYVLIRCITCYFPLIGSEFVHRNFDPFRFRSRRFLKMGTGNKECA